MPDGLIDTAAQSLTPAESRVYGVCVAEVIDNQDLRTLGRVRIRLPWLPGVEPWARVAAPMAGPDRGMYFMPQPNDEVLVAFNHGDLNEPYVIGCLWNLLDRPPVTAPTDAVYKRIIRTPQGHELVFDDLRESITITSTSGHIVSIEPEKIAVSTAGATARLTLDKEGKVTIAAKRQIALEAPQISITATGAVSITGSTGVQIKAENNKCEIRGAPVTIN